LKVLIACIPTPLNRFLIDLKTGLEKQDVEVIWDYEEFWRFENHYDIIHIHWPEYLSYELETYLMKTIPLPNDLWKRISECFEYWSRNSTIVYTRHNLAPHQRNDDDFKKLYRFAASYSKTVIHFANFSIAQFKEFYPELEGINHVLIPHHNYASLPNTSTREQARKILNIEPDTRVMLVFGGVKENEKEIINNAYGYLPGKKILLAPGWKINRRKIGYIRLRELVWKFEKFIAAKNKSKRINLGYINEEDTQYYLNAADFLFIPRTNELNSGNVTLGCTFGLVVVGKKGTNIGEILEETGNPTFEVGNEESLKFAIEKSCKLMEQHHGNKNKEIALSKWSVGQIADMYYLTMKKSIAK